MNDLIFVGKHTLINNVPKHAHVYYEVILCTGGNGTMVFDHMKLDYQEGDIIIIPPLISHMNTSTGGFSNYFLNINLCSLNMSEPIIIRSSYNDTIKGIFESAFAFYSSPDMADADLLSSFGHLIVSYLSLYNPDKDTHQLSQTVKKTIINRYSDNSFDIGEYLKTLPFNDDYIIKCFKSDFGLTPHKYLNKVRLNCAARLLENSADHNITEIAFTSGFRDPLYFSRLFKKEYGVPPSQYVADNPAFFVEDPDKLKI